MTSIFALAAVFGSFFSGKRALVLENLALRQQLAVYNGQHRLGSEGLVLDTSPDGADPLFAEYG